MGSGGAVGARGAMGGSGQDTETKRVRVRGTHSLEGADPGLVRTGAKSAHVRCTLAGEDDNRTELMLQREDWSEAERKRATHLSERAEEGLVRTAKGC